MNGARDDGNFHFSPVAPVRGDEVVVVVVVLVGEGKRAFSGYTAGQSVCT